MIDFACRDFVLPLCLTTIPVTPESSLNNSLARASYQISTPCLRAMPVSESTSPGPPPTVSSVSPPQNLNPPPMLNACRPQAAVNRTPLERIHEMVGRLRL